MLYQVVRSAGDWRVSQWRQQLLADVPGIWGASLPAAESWCLWVSLPCSTVLLRTAVHVAPPHRSSAMRPLVPLAALFDQQCMPAGAAAAHP